MTGLTKIKEPFYQHQKKLFNHFHLHKIYWFPNLKDIISIKKINILCVYRARDTIILTLITANDKMEYNIIFRYNSFI
jgi:hypothetical protein